MKSSRPPTLATWFLKHLRLEEMDEALLGDLFEDFRQGRSAAWYWRQVVSAIVVSFAKQLRYRWVSTAFAILWAYGVSVLFTQSVWPPVQIQHLLEPFVGWAIRFEFPISMIWIFGMYSAILSAAETAIVMLGLGLYLGVVRNLTLRGFLRGSLTAVSVIILGNLGLALVGFILQSFVKAEPAQFFVQISMSIPVFLGLVLSMASGRFRHLKTCTPSA
jgi:hypothetical protein